MKTYANGRAMIDVGCDVAIASDYNPGSCAIQSMPLIMFLSNLYCNLSLNLSFKACTYNAAKALKIGNVGLIEEGFKADLLIWNVDNLENIPYTFDNSENHISTIIKNGNCISL